MLEQQDHLQPPDLQLQLHLKTSLEKQTCWAVAAAAVSALVENVNSLHY
jgi:hypothetical protein